MQIKHFGWRKEPADIRDLGVFHEKVGLWKILKHNEEGIIKHQKSKSTTLPTIKDNRNYCTPIVDQGDLGSCTANAGVGMVQYLQKRGYHTYVPSSRIFLYKVTRLLMGQEGIGDSGAYIRTTLKALALFGVPPESLIPYNIAKFDVEPNAFAYQFASNYQALKYVKLDVHEDQSINLNMIKSMVSLGYPVQFGFNVYGSYDQTETNGGCFPFPTNNEAIEGGHSVLIVGYDDNKIITNALDKGGLSATTGAFLIRNSWGTSWGDKGYGWLPYHYQLTGLADDFWTLQKAEWIDESKFD